MEIEELDVVEVDGSELDVDKEETEELDVVDEDILVVLDIDEVEMEELDVVEEYPGELVVLPPSGGVMKGG
jgi:hypothetical protein